MTRIERRRFLLQSAATGIALASARLPAQNVNEQLNVGFIGLGGRGTALLDQFSQLREVRIAALCDPDEKHLDAASGKHGAAKKHRDLRSLLDDSSIDAVVIATCNHWHALAAIWACQAEKHVYVEKPLAHNHWEGQQVVRAARKYDRIVQIGTQQRSDPLQDELKNFLHVEKALGEIKHVQVCRIGEREPIGKRSKPLRPPQSLDYNLWLGPAQEQPIYRDKLHYDWHWNWNTGNGEMGNWGVHVLDDAINVALLDRVPFPKRIAAAGGRVCWNDAGETPNVFFAYYDTGSIPVLYAMTNLPNGSKQQRHVDFQGVESGYVVECEGGYYAGGRGGGKAFDTDGKLIKRFSGDSGTGHAHNFVAAVRDGDRRSLKAEVELGHRSSSWCNLANIAARVGGPYQRNIEESINPDLLAWRELINGMELHLATNHVDPPADLLGGPPLEFDAQQEAFIGNSAEPANQLLRREYRSAFQVPSVT